MTAVADAVPGLSRLHAETLGAAGVRVAVVDGHWDSSHSVFRGGRVEHLEAVHEKLSVHAMQVASILAGQVGSPLLGVAPEATFLSVPVLGASGSCSQEELAVAISTALAHDAHVVNVSAGAPSASGRAEPVLTDAVRECASRGVLIVAAAGNEGCPCLHVPGSLPAVLPVGAMDGDGRPLPSSNWGEEYECTGILAPGLQIPALDDQLSEIGSLTGTSAATAIVSGVVALFLSLQLRYGEPPDAFQIAELLRSSALDHCDGVSLDCRRILRGRLDIEAALAAFLGGRAMNDDDTSTDTTVVQEHSDAGAGVTDAAGGGVRRAASVAQSLAECESCGTAVPSTLAYVIGQLDVDFVSDSRLASLAQEFGFNPGDREMLVKHLKKVPSDAAGLLWILKVDETPAYVVAPSGAFAGAVYLRLVEFLEDMEKGVERVAMAGVAGGSFMLRSGQSIPLLVPELRGLASWTTEALVQASAGNGSKKKSAEHQAAVGDFLERLYYSVRNLGITSSDRAKNYAATNAFNVSKVFEDAIERRLQLDTVEVERAPVGSPASDVWDVKLVFFDPENTNRARRYYLFNVDVGDIPYTRGSIRSWSAR